MFYLPQYTVFILKSYLSYIKACFDCFCTTYRAEVVTLQFSHERRDRRKREYVMIELNHEAIVEILAPISEENQKAFSLASKVEVGTCKSKSIV